MPNIRQFENRQNLQPDDRAARATSFAANTVRASYGEAGREIGSGLQAFGEQYSRIQAQQEISAGLAASAEIQDGFTTQWDVTLKNADPNDPSTAPQFRQENVEPALEAWVGTFQTEQGKQWATNRAASIRQHFFEKTAADQSFLAGRAAIQNIQQFSTGMSNTVLQDPTSLNMALGTVDQAILAIIEANPALDARTAANVSTELRESLRKELVKSAFIGMSRANPDAAMQALQDGFGATILDGTDRNQMYGFAESIKREKAQDARAEVAAQKAAQKEDFDTKRGAMYASMFKPDGSVVVPPGFHEQLVMMSQHPGADADAIKSLGDAAATATRAQIDGTYQRTSAATWQDLASRIGRPPTDPQALTGAMVDKAYAQGKLSQADWRFLNSAAAGTTSDPAQTAAMRQLNGSLDRIKPLVDRSNLYSGRLDQSGIALYDDLHYDVYQKYNALIAEGKSPTEAATILTDPRDPRGIQAMLPAYQTTNKQGLKVIQQRTQSTGGPTPIPQAPAAGSARKPGESPEDYLKRIGK